ncbi:MAG: TniQ family protein, partial [Clostridia bacterium]|nr:TniQ family protein [Clostridia bacterium]
MLTYFPSFYNDELVYSLLARYYQKSGYMAYAFVAQDLFEKTTMKPNIEFVNKFSSDAFCSLTRNFSFENIIEKHTMFPYYARFLNKDRRNKAFQSLLSMDEKSCNLIYLPKNKNNEVRYLRYCPICASVDKQNYGETYWHRSHQLIGVDICPIHFCSLLNSAVTISSKEPPSLITAEEGIENLSKEIIYSKNELEIQLSRYVYCVFQSNINFETDIKIGQFLHSKMENTDYVSKRGEQRNISLFHSDFIEYYKPLKENPISELWQIQKVLTNYRFNTYEISMIAMFLNISVKELTDMKLPNKTQKELFDEQIIELQKKGLKYPEIAKKLNASYDVVKSIGEGRYGKHRNCSESTGSSKGGAKQKDWADIDDKRLPEVIDCIKKLQNADTRPVRISIGMIERLLGYPKKSMYHCPFCMAEIKKHEECMEEYWTREVLWAVKSIKENNLPLNFTNIQKITNMRKENFIRCAP